MRKLSLPFFLTALLGCLSSYAQTGPFDPEKWPTTALSAKLVHFVSTDTAFTPLGANWVEGLQILTGGDQVTAAITIGGHQGLKVTGSYLNIADPSFTDWADKDTIDILMQVYGDAALLNASGNPRNFNFLTGVLPNLSFPIGGSLPVEVNNKKWNWVLFRIPNGLRPDGVSRYVGSIPEGAGGGSGAGGVNGGTIRVESVPNMIVRLVAFGEQGAFGEPEQVNVFAAGETCDPEPETNRVFVDANTRTNFHLTILNDGDQTVAYQDNVGPAGDRRRAVRAEGTYMNFGITDYYLGKPCNDPRSIKIGVEFYDDPALTGTVFGTGELCD